MISLDSSFAKSSKDCLGRQTKMTSSGKFAFVTSDISSWIEL